MAKSKVQLLKEQQQNSSKSELAARSSILPGDDTSGVKNDLDIKAKVGIEVRFGRGDIITPDQKENRIVNTTEMFLRGYTEGEVVRSMIYQWEISKESANFIVREAKKQISEPWRAHFEEEVDWHVATRKRIIRKNSVEGGDDKMVLAALDSLARVQRIYDVMPILDPQGTEFDEGEKGLTSYQDIIDDVQNGDEESLENFKKSYKENDKRGIEFEGEDED